MTDEEALLAAVKARPDDDLPRLVMADWYEERGEEARASLIRVQVELARTPEPEVKTTGNQFGEDPDEFRRRTCMGCRKAGTDCRWCLLVGRERELLAAKNPASNPGFEWTNAGRWSWPLPTIDLEYPERFRRGFVSEVACTAAAWLANGDDVCQAHPVRRVTLTEPFRWEMFDGSPLPPPSHVWLHGQGMESTRRFYNGKPFRDWTDLEAAWVTHDSRRSPDGEPMHVPDRERIAHILGLRWPGVSFSLPPGPTYYDAVEAFEDMNRQLEELRREAPLTTTGDLILQAIRRAAFQVGRPLGVRPPDPPR